MQNNLFLSNRFIKSFHLTFSIVPQLKKKKHYLFQMPFWSITVTKVTKAHGFCLVSEQFLNALR